MTYNPYQNKQASARGQEIKLMDVLSKVLDVPGEFRIQRDGQVVVSFSVSRLPDGSLEFTNVTESGAPATVPPPPLYTKKSVADAVYVSGNFTGYELDGVWHD